MKTAQLAIFLFSLLVSAISATSSTTSTSIDKEPKRDTNSESSTPTGRRKLDAVLETVDSVRKLQAVQIATVSHSEGRRLAGWWSILSHVLPCPPGPLGKKCHDHKNGGDGSGGTGTGSGSDGSDSSGSGYNDDGSGSYGNDDGSGSYGNDDGSGSYGNDDGSGGGNVNGADNGGGDGSGGDGDGSGGGNMITNFMNSPEGHASAIVLAAAAASVAIGAMYMGSRRRHATRDNHSLNGILKKRIGLFSRMAHRTQGGLCRPERVKDAVIDDASGADYRLA